MNNNFNLMKMWNPEKLIIPNKENYDLRCWYKKLEKKLKEKKHQKLGDKIISKHICFETFYMPASSIIYLKHSYEDCEHLVLIDTELFKKLFDDDEKCALLLHELGHFFYRPKENFQEIDEEYCADDYVRKLGFQKELLSSLKKYKEWKEKNDFEVDIVYVKRIKRIEENDEIKDGIEI